MPNFKKHAVAGGSIGLTLTAIVNLLQQQNRKKNNSSYKFNWGELIIKSLAGGGIGAFCGVLPDFLEPASSPNHRKFFHSITAATAIGAGMVKANKSNLPGSHKELINLVGTCYLSHLLLDGETISGLPLVA
jgi:membrane-bound metal-dependent hydrolase YbcI (DUF457 family)